MLSLLNEGWVGSAIGLIGIAVGVALYRKSLRIPKPRVSFRSDQALTWPSISALPEGMSITYHGKAVPRVARSVIRIWNAGQGCFPKSLIAEHDSLRFTLENDGTFLQAIVLRESNPASKVSVTIDPTDQKSTYVSFEFLNPQDGCVIGLLHTDKHSRPLLKGTVLGYKWKEIEDVPLRLFKPRFRKLQPIFLQWGPMLVGCMSLAYALGGPDLINVIREQLGVTAAPSIAPVTTSRGSRIAYLILGTTYLAGSCYFFWRGHRPYPKSLSWTPKATGAEDN
jgi:hypothetical protein